MRRAGSVRKKRGPPTIPPREAKRRAKRENERIKLTATFLNGSGIAILFAVVILPLFKSFGTHPEPIATGQTLTGVSFAFGFHLAGYLILGLWRSED